MNLDDLLTQITPLAGKDIDPKLVRAYQWHAGSVLPSLVKALEELYKSSLVMARRMESVRFDWEQEEPQFKAAFDAAEKALARAKEVKV